MRWNEKYNLYGKAPKQILKEGTGSNADLNFILISMLTDAGIPAYPVVMSRRNMGILPLTHPSLQKLNTFIVGIAHTDTTLVYLDSSVEDGYLNVLPPLLMTNRARVIIPGNHSQWVNLEALGTNQLRSAVIASISPEGTILVHAKHFIQVSMLPAYGISSARQRTAPTLSTSWLPKKTSRSSHSG